MGFCIVNGENAANGRGLTPKLADKLLGSGADVVTWATTCGRATRSSPIWPDRIG